MSAVPREGWPAWRDPGAHATSKSSTLTVSRPSREGRKEAGPDEPAGAVESMLLIIGLLRRVDRRGEKGPVPDGRSLSSSGSNQARKGRLVDALAVRGDEGRDTLR